jgi:hypothetical protein
MACRLGVSGELACERGDFLRTAGAPSQRNQRLAQHDGSNLDSEDFLFQSAQAERR